MVTRDGGKDRGIGSERRGSPPNPRVIVALDFADPTQAVALVERLEPEACALKVGKELFVSAGPEPVRWMIARGFRVFLDLKFHDIPHTVALACAAATRLGVWMLNVHAAGGRAMLVAARESVTRTAAGQQRPPPLLIGVTVLTSLAAADLEEIGIGGAPEAAALRLARLCAACGLDGVVCSALEAPVLRRALGPEFKLVTPGIRPAGSAIDDQARVLTPEAAVANGADFLVIGRPITQASDPRAALARVNAALEAAA
jgi:orotidine-5'-phosphate decarboxylase